MIPDNSRKKLEQLRQEASLRAQLQKQYDKEMASKYTRDMPSFSDWLSQRQQKPMAKGGLAKFLEPSAVKDRMYHGTTKDFKEFRKGRTWFSSDPDYANIYAGELTENHGENGRVMPLHIQAKNPKIFPATSEGRLEWTKPEHHDTYLKRKGHDSVLFVDDKGKVATGYTFEPHQIKSAIGNRGTYDTTDPDITKAKGGKVQAKRLYHGTNKDFKNFNVGSYLTADPSYASKHGNIVMPVHMSASNIKTIPDENFRLMAGRPSALKPYIDAGYDALSSDSGQGDYIILDPNKVKSAISMAKGGLAEFLRQSKVKHPVYHGTDESFNEFDTAKSKDEGHFFSNDYDDANTYGAKVKKVHLSLKNPYQTTWSKISEELGGDPSLSPWSMGIEALKKKGHDSFIVKADRKSKAHHEEHGEHEYGYDQYVAFHPHQIRSADITKATGGTVEPSQDEMRLALSKAKRHGMYSPLERLAIDIPRTKGTGAEFMAEISKQKGFKPEEVADRKIPIPEGKMTKLEFLKHLRQHSLPPLQEFELPDMGHGSEARNERANDYYGDDYENLSPEQQIDVADWARTHRARYGQYQIPGGENYREMLLKLPSLSVKDERAINYLQMEKRRTDPTEWAQSEDAKRLDALMEKAKKFDEPYRSGHWRMHPNVLAHVRLSDREGADGEKLLHLEELQSDWHQQGRKQGYRKSKEELMNEQSRLIDEHEAKVKLESKRLNDEYKDIKQRLRNIADPNSDEGRLLQGQEIMTLRQLTALSEAEPPVMPKNTGVPQAPFKKSWHELGMKHVLHHAAKNGYHGVVITPGQEQAERWGDEGLKVHYDKKIPEFLNKFGQKHGVKVGQMPISTKGEMRAPTESLQAIQDAGITVDQYLSMLPEQREKFDYKTKTIPLHYFPITEPMRASILKEGMPQYVSGGVVHKAEGGAVLPIEKIKAQMANRFSSLSQLQSIGAEEAPSLGVKAYVPTSGSPDNNRMPVGGIDTSKGDLPVGGIDMNSQQMGQQLMPNAPPAPAGAQQGMNQVPRGDKIGTMDGTGMPPNPNANPNQMGSNILSVTPQGQALAALKPQGLAKGGNVSIEQMKDELANRPRPMCMTHDHGYADGGQVFEEAKTPKKTVKAYKLFRTDKKKPNKLFPLFVDANTPVETGKWLAAKEGEMRGSKVKSKIGDLAYRPGWHAGDLPVATHIGEKSDPSLKAPDTRPDNHVWAEVEMPHDVDWQTEANKRGTNAQGKVVPVKAHITDQIPHGGHYRYKTNPNMTGNWLIGGAMKVNRVLSDAEVKKINKAAGVADLPRRKKQKLSDYGFAEGGTVNMARGGMPFAIKAPQALPKAPSDFTPYDTSKPSIPSLAKAFDESIAHHLSLSPEDRMINSQRAAMQVAHHIGMTSDNKPKDLLGQNEKLLKSGKGIEGQEPVKLPDGRGVETTGLALAPAYEEGNFNTCPNHHSCKAECLGKTSGNYFKLGGGQDLEEFKGPRLNSLLKTNAFLRDPHALAVKLYDEIDSAKQMAAANGNHLGVRLNVLSDINPRVHKALIEAHPDVTFYDYTKNNTNPIAPNHHYTYSSTGVSQPGVENQHTNWKQMRRRLDQGDNVAMAFSHKDHLPEVVHDQETGKKYKVINGDTHDFRPLDLVGEGEDGVIVGLKNKKATGKMNEAHIDSKGFFLHYDPQLKMAQNAKGLPVYARTASTRISPTTGKPMLGETIPQNRTVNIQPQTRGMIPLTNDGEKQ